MKKRRHTPEEIIRKLRQGEVLLGQGKLIADACRDLCISDATYYKWRREYGGMGLSQAKRLKHLEVENARLKRLVADMALDIRVLKDAAEGNFGNYPATVPATLYPS